MEPRDSTPPRAQSRAAGRRSGPPRAARIAYLLGRIGRSQGARLTEQLAPLGLRPKHFALLNIVAADEGSSQQKLGERLDLEPSGIVPTIDELEAQGLLQRRRDPEDRRRYALYLTPEGHAKLAEARTAAAERATQLLQPLDAAELAVLEDMLTRIAARDDRNIRPLGN
jgi:DNA-binding MarR family transcriptional regulator